MSKKVVLLWLQRQLETFLQNVIAPSHRCIPGGVFLLLHSNRCRTALFSFAPSLSLSPSSLPICQRCHLDSEESTEKATPLRPPSDSGSRAEKGVGGGLFGAGSSRHCSSSPHAKVAQSETRMSSSRSLKSRRPRSIATQHRRSSPSHA
jgi:hypothetical protein